LDDSCNPCTLSIWVCFQLLKHLYASWILSCMVCGTRIKLFACCSMPAFLAQALRTKLPMVQPCLQLSRPFQYKIQLMAQETWGHHCTVPAWSFLHFVSACLLYLVAALLMASYSSCWIFVKQIFTSDASVCTWASSLSSFNDVNSICLYLVTTHGSLHWRHHADGLLINSVSTRQMHWVGMSTTVHGGHWGLLLQRWGILPGNAWVMLKEWKSYLWVCCLNYVLLVDVLHGDLWSLQLARQIIAYFVFLGLWCHHSYLLPKWCCPLLLAIPL